MKRPPPPLHFIRSFECSARHLSFTKAADELGYTQAAISTHVRALEKYVGRPLFTRNARSLELTEVGEAFLLTLRQALNHIYDATEAIVAGSRTSSVVVACPMSLTENWLCEVVASFSERYPKIDIVLNGTVWEETEDKVADIIISIHHSDTEPHGSKRLWNEQLQLLCSAETATRIRSPSDLSKLQRIVVFGRQGDWAAMASALGIDEWGGMPALKTNASNISLELAAQGVGITIALASLGTIYVSRGLLVEPFRVRIPSLWHYYIRTAALGQNSAARKFEDHVLLHAKKLSDRVP